MEPSEDELEMVVRYVVVRGFLRSCAVEPDKIIESATRERLNKKLDDCTAPYTQAELDRFFTARDDGGSIFYQPLTR